MYGYRKCAEPGCDRHFIPKSSRNRFCLKHRKTKPIDPAHCRKYGPGHRQRLAQWAPRVAAGNVNCSRCGELIDPNEPWDLDHIDGGHGDIVTTVRTYTHVLDDARCCTIQAKVPICRHV